MWLSMGPYGALHAPKTHLAGTKHVYLAQAKSRIQHDISQHFCQLWRPLLLEPNGGEFPVKAATGFSLQIPD